MAGKVFVIEELRWNGSLKRFERASPERFEWTAAKKSSPVGGWPYEIVMRTKRMDYVGASEPVEQILGTNFEPFTISGRWDDKFNTADFAARTSQEMEDLVARCSPVRVSFDDVSFIGLIRRLKVTYRYHWLREYEFEVSPHRKEGSGQTRSLSSDQVKPVRDYDAEVQRLAEEIKQAHEIAPVRYMVGDLHATVDALVTNVVEKAARISAVIEGRVLAISDSAVNSVAKVVADLNDLRSAAREMRLSLHLADAATDIYFDDTVIALDFDGWARGLCVASRALAWNAFVAARELQRRVTPDAQSLYRPRAGESLYDIANMFFGTPTAHRLIAERNNLYQMEFEGTELIIIPSRS